MDLKKIIAQYKLVHTQKNEDFIEEQLKKRARSSTPEKEESLPIEKDNITSQSVDKSKQNLESDENSKSVDQNTKSTDQKCEETGKVGVFDGKRFSLKGGKKFFGKVSRGIGSMVNKMFSGKDSIVAKDKSSEISKKSDQDQLDVDPSDRSDTEKADDNKNFKSKVRQELQNREKENEKQQEQEMTDKEKEQENFYITQILKIQKNEIQNITDRSQLWVDGIESPSPIKQKSDQDNLGNALGGSCKKKSMDEVMAKIESMNSMLLNNSKDNQQLQQLQQQQQQIQKRNISINDMFKKEEEQLKVFEEKVPEKIIQENRMKCEIVKETCDKIDRKVSREKSDSELKNIDENIQENEIKIRKQSSEEIPR